MRYNNNNKKNRFERYMHLLEADRIKLVEKEGEKSFREANKKLLAKYEESNSAEKLEIRNKLVMLNIRLAHEILYKKLRINTGRKNSEDILQEINLILIESIDKILEDKRRMRKFSQNLFYRIMGRLYRIGKEYDIEKSFVLEENFEIPQEELEESYRKVDFRKYYSELRSPEEKSVMDMYFEGMNPDEIELRTGFNRNFQYQTYRRFVKIVSYGMQEEKRKEGVLKELMRECKEVLKKNPRIKYILLFPKHPEDILPDEEKHIFGSDRVLGMIYNLIYRGIDPREWLFVDNREKSLYVQQTGCISINHLYVDKQIIKDLSDILQKDTILDINFRVVIPNSGMYSNKFLYKCITEDYKKLIDSREVCYRELLSEFNTRVIKEFYDSLRKLSEERNKLKIKSINLKSIDKKRKIKNELLTLKKLSEEIERELVYKFVIKRYIKYLK